MAVVCALPSSLLVMLLCWNVDFGMLFLVDVLMRQATLVCKAVRHSHQSLSMGTKPSHWQRNQSSRRLRRPAECAKKRANTPPVSAAGLQLKILSHTVKDTFSYIPNWANSSWFTSLYEENIWRVIHYNGNQRLVLLRLLAGDRHARCEVWTIGPYAAAKKQSLLPSKWAAVACRQVRNGILQR